jgi:hypothetical protein
MRSRGESWEIRVEMGRRRRSVTVTYTRAD